MKSIELQEKRAAVIAEAHKINDKAAAEDREMTPEEGENFDKAMADADALKVSIGRAVKLEEEGRNLAEPSGEGDGATPPAGDLPENRSGSPFSGDLYHRGFCRYLATGDTRGLVEAMESRNLQVDIDTDGGFITAEEQFVNELIKELDDKLVVRQVSRKFRVATAQSLGAPKRTAKMSTFAWGQEVVAPTADTALKFGKRQLHPHPLTGEILVSRALMRMGLISPDVIVREEMARDAGETQETAFMTGSGSGQPLGIFTADAEGISTSRDVSTGNTSTAMTFDGLFEAFFSLKDGPRNSSTWIFHRDGVKQLRKLKDGDGRYIWEQSVRAGQPDTLMNRPVLDSEFAPNTFTASLYVGIVGDFSHYWIADAMDMDIQMLQELHARTNQIGFIGRLSTDGAPVLEESFARVKLAA